MNRRVVAFLCSALTWSGCASMQKARGHDDVAEAVRARTGLQTGWEKGPPDAAAVRAQVRQLLGGGLTREEALRIALVNSPELQVDFEELGVAQADLIAAGLLSNPSLSGALMGPVSRDGTKLEFSLVQSLLDAVMLPARRTVAATQFRAAVLRTGQRALDVVLEVSEAFTEAQAAQRLLDYRVTAAATLEASAELAKLQFDAGNITELELAIKQSAWQDARTQLAREELEWLARRERLNRQLGLWGEEIQWTIAEKLPELPAQDPPLLRLEQRALRRRLDVEAARADLHLLDQALALASSSRAFGMIEIGIQGEREPDGLTVLGPSLSLELPIFDQRQPMIGRLEAQQRQAEQRLTGVSINARSEVRQARAELVTARRLVEHYARNVVPTRRRILKESQLHYNAMALSPYQLFEARREEAAAIREYVEALAMYWNARVRLEHATGGKLEEAK